MSVCRSCGALIHWVLTSSQRWHPVDPGKVWITTDGTGEGPRKTVLDSHGRVRTGRQIGKAAASKKAETVSGFESHFASCPFAERHRKRSNEGAGQ